MLSGDPGSDLAVPGALLIPALLRKPRHSPLLSSYFSSHYSPPLLYPPITPPPFFLSHSVRYVEGVLSTGNSANLIKKLVEVVKL